MATKAEQFRTQKEREHPAGEPRSKRARKSQRKPKKAAFSRDKAGARAKATRALETTRPGKRPSRKSTRSSANRAKPDVAFNLTEEIKKGSPQARARKARARRTTVRGRATPR
jgi:hypothetical protein